MPRISEVSVRNSAIVIALSVIRPPKADIQDVQHVRSQVIGWEITQRANDEADIQIAGHKSVQRFDAARYYRACKRVYFGDDLPSKLAHNANRATGFGLPLEGRF